jgi:pimeloyl-ACP methyl ester carboxylesterase
LVDAVLPGFNWSAAQSAMDGAVWEEGRRSGPEAAKALWLKHPLFGPAQGNPPASALLKEIVADYTGWHFVNHDPQHYPDPPASQRLHTITAPTLVVVGELDLPDFLAIGKTLARDIPDAKEIVLQQVGHMSNMEAPTQFNKSVLEFLAQVKS